MDTVEALERLRRMHRAVICTLRSDGLPQMSPVVCAVLGDNRLVVSTRQTARKVHQLRRDPRVALCVFTDEFFGAWLQVEGTADIVALPEAMDLLVAYYRAVSGEHPDWEEYRQAMVEEQRVALVIDISRAGPDRQG